MHYQLKRFDSMHEHPCRKLWLDPVLLMDKTDAMTDRQTDRWTEHKSTVYL